MLFELIFLFIAKTNYTILITEKRKRFTNETLFENQANFNEQVTILYENGFLHELFYEQNNLFVKNEQHEEFMMILS